MSGKSEFVEGEHGPAILEGPATALSWTTILPIRGATAFDRITGARVLASLPVAGIAHALVATLIGWLGARFGADPLLVAALITAALELFSRFMHLDGLADVADGLGSYAPPARAREILADSSTGLIGMAAAVLSMGVFTAATAALLADAHWEFLWAPILGARIAAMVNGHTGFHPMNPKGFGALMVGTVRTWWIAAWCAVYAVLAASISALEASSLAAIYLLMLLGVLAFMLLLAVCLARHCSRRFEGLNGDTSGFVLHVTATAGMVLLALFLPLI